MTGEANDPETKKLAQLDAEVEEAQKKLNESREVLHESREELGDAQKGLESAFLMYEQAMGERVRSVREDQGLSQAELARRMKARGFNLHQTAIAKLETGKRPLRVGEFFALSDCLGYSPMGLFYLPAHAPVEEEVAEVDDLMRRAGEGARESKAEMEALFRRMVDLQVDREAHLESLARRLEVLRQGRSQRLEMGGYEVGTGGASENTD